MKIGCIIPSTSKGRDWESIEESYLYGTTLKSFVETCNNEHTYTFYIGIDKNDPIYDNDQNKEIIQSFCPDMDMKFEFVYMDGIQPGHLTLMWNRLFELAYRDNCDYFFQCGDDIDFKTKNWINDCIAALEKSDGIGLTGPINNNSKILTQTFVSVKHMELFGYYFPEEIINWFCDDWINDIYKDIERFYPLHNHICINMGGNPRYNINNDIFINQKDFEGSIRKMSKLNDAIVKRDLKRIKCKI